MEAVACGRDYHYVHHQPLSAKTRFYASSDNHHHDASPKDSILQSSLSGSENAELESLPVDLNSCKVSSSIRSSCCSQSLEPQGRGYDSNGKGCANGHHSDGAHETLESFKPVNWALSHTCMDGCYAVAEQNDGILGAKLGSVEGTVKGTDGIMDANSVESVNGAFLAPLHVPQSMEVLDFDVSLCYSPDEWSSRASTDSPLSASASPQPLAWPSPAFNRCKTAPVGASSTSSGNEHAPLFSRSKTDNERKQKPSEALHQMPGSAEKLSERKRKKIIENLVRIKNDGTVEVDVDRGSKISPTLFELHPADQLADNMEEECKDPIKSVPSYLEIAMLIVGTRGDVQPFVSIGKKLKERGHRVRLATHANFRGFVTSNDLEFYPLGGDPKILAGYMVKNKGFLPSGPSEISIQKKQLKAIMNSLLPACTKADGDSGAPFKADAIIANPIAYGHVDVAEYLDVPLHIFFTMPWTPTNEFPHPLARVKQQAGYWMSYHVVDSLIWWGMRSSVNEFRVKELKLNPMKYFNWNQGSIAHLPTGYMWSPHLVPKPKDWGPRVDVVGFCFLSLAKDYKPPDALAKWLAAGERPIYVGFGSLVSLFQP